MNKLYCSLYESLTEAFMTPELQGRVPEWLPLSPFSVKALSHGSQPRQYPGPIRYADLLEYHNFITEGRGFGRVPSGKTFHEIPLANMSELANTQLAKKCTDVDGLGRLSWATSVRLSRIVGSPSRTPSQSLVQTRIILVHRTHSSHGP